MKDLSTSAKAIIGELSLNRMRPASLGNLDGADTAWDPSDERVSDALLLFCVTARQTPGAVWGALEHDPFVLLLPSKILVSTNVDHFRASENT